MALPGGEAAFSFAAGTTYLDHGGFGVAPTEVLRFGFRMREAVEAAPRPFFDRECRPRWREIAGQVAQRFSASPGDLALVENVTEGANAVLRAASLQPDEEILLTSMTYGASPSRRGASRRSEARGSSRRGFRFRARPRAVRRGDPRGARAAHEARDPRSRHLGDRAGPAGRRDGDDCRERGVRVLVDGAHAPGAVPLDVPSIGADWYVGNLHKWHFAPRGCGFLWARPDRRELLAPAVLSWEIEKPFPQSFEWTGTRDPSGWLSVPAAFDFMDRFGEAAVRAHNHDLVMEASRLSGSGLERRDPKRPRAWSAR